MRDRAKRTDDAAHALTHVHPSSAFADANDPVRTVLANGLTVLVRRDDSAPVVAIVTHVRAGYFDETDDVVGIAHVLEHMYFKGTSRRGVGEIARATKAAGGYLNAGTIYDRTSYYTVLPAARLAEGLDIQADAYADSSIDAHELRRELEVIIQEAKRKADTPGAVTVESMFELLHDRHRMRRWRIGREDQLRRLTRDDVARFYRGFYRPRNTTLAIVGDIDPDAALADVDRLYGALPDAPVVRDVGPVEPAHRGLRARELAGDVTQAHFAIGWRTPGTLDPDTPRLELAAAVLSAGRASRLYRAVRECALAASIGSYDYTPTELGVFVASGEGSPATTADALRATWSEIHAVRARGPGDGEMLRARRLLESRFIRQRETMEGQAAFLAEWEALGDWRLGVRHEERVLAATAGDVVGAMARWLDPDAAAVVVYRPRTAPPVAADVVALRALLGSPVPTVGEAAASTVVQRLAAPTPEREPARDQAGVRVYRTERGVPILVRRKGGAPLVHMGVQILGGACDEPPDVAGLTALLTRTAVKGTKRRDAAQIATDAELLGGTIAPHASAESFGWSISVPASRADEALALIGDVIQHPTFPAAALESERAVAIADVALARDDMYRWPLRLVAEAAFAGHPYGVSAAGDERTLAAIDAERVRAWHRDRVLASPAAIAIVGDIDPDAVARAAARELGTLTTSAAGSLATPVWRSGASRVEERDKAQTAIALAFPAPSRRDTRRFAAELLAGIMSGLGGRLFEELRDRRSLAYTVSAFPVERRAAGLFVAYIATSPDREDAARSGLLRELARLRTEDVAEHELRRAQEYAIGTHAIRRQSGASVLAEVIDAWLLGDSLAELASYETDVRAVSARAIREVAEELDERTAVEGVVRGRAGSREP